MSALTKLRLSIFCLAMFLPEAGIFAADSLSPVPAAQLDAARKAKECFERGQYVEAEKIYEQIVAASPKNLYALSNLGVVRFRSGKYKLAAEVLRRAVAVAPYDEFSQFTLGIVYYSSGQYDDAIQTLTRAIGINPKDAGAHYYLGATYSKIGWKDAAAKELEIAGKLAPELKDPFTDPEKKFPRGLEFHES
jgi:tetratricopeptide (TPR) repeat protein